MFDHVPDTAITESSAEDEGSYVFRDEAILGTRMQMHLQARNHSAAKAAAITARAEIDRLNSIFNSRDTDSELSILNCSLVHQASPELFAVVRLAERWRVESEGAYSGRLGKVIAAWRSAESQPPSRATAATLARAAETATVQFDTASRTIIRPDAVEFALDGLAKGWIVDRAYDAVRADSDIYGALIDIGGDIRCGGQSPGNKGWNVGIGDGRLPFDNAPLVATTTIWHHGIATSGRGPRDRIINGTCYSATLSPFDGWPVEHRVSSTVIASSAADADALATATLVATSERAQSLTASHNANARILSRDGEVVWTTLAQSQSTAQFMPVQAVKAQERSEDGYWKDGWQALATFTAPRRQLIRDPDFRSPYMAMWITDPANNPIRTLILIGKRTDWQKDNFIWWSVNRPKTDKLIATRSMSTSGAGVYNVFWNGVDDLGRIVPAGKYVLHVETSREHGKHTYRSLNMDFNKFARFVDVLPPTEEGGGLRVSFDHY